MYRDSLIASSSCLWHSDGVDPMKVRSVVSSGDISNWTTNTHTINVSGTKQGAHKFNQANFQEISRRDFKINPGHVCLASASNVMYRI